jgi:hypothetical protein
MAVPPGASHVSLGPTYLGYPRFFLSAGNDNKKLKEEL